MRNGHHRGTSDVESITVVLKYEKGFMSRSSVNNVAK
jgi:hypothetical protein